MTAQARIIVSTQRDVTDLFSAEPPTRSGFYWVMVPKRYGSDEMDEPEVARVWSASMHGGPSLNRTQGSCDNVSGVLFGPRVVL